MVDKERKFRKFQSWLRVDGGKQPWVIPYLPTRGLKSRTVRCLLLAHRRITELTSMECSFWLIDGLWSQTPSNKPIFDFWKIVVNRFRQNRFWLLVDLIQPPSPNIVSSILMITSSRSRTELLDAIHYNSVLPNTFETIFLGHTHSNASSSVVLG